MDETQKYLLKIKTPKPLTVGLLFIGILFAGFGWRLYWNLYDPKYLDAMIEIRSTQEKLDIYKKVCGNFPTTQEGLEVFFIPAKNKCLNYPKDKMYDLGFVPTDPWDQKFTYISDGNVYSFYTSYENLFVIGTDKKIAEVYELKLR